MEDLKNREFTNYIAGKWSPCASGAPCPISIRPIPTTSWVISRRPKRPDARAAVAAAQAAFAQWKAMPITRRAQVLYRAADYLEAHVAQFAEELTREEGKAIGLSRDEILRSAQTLRFYAAEGQILHRRDLSQRRPRHGGL